MQGRSVTIVLDKERHLRYDLNAIALISEKLQLTLRLGHLVEDLVSRPIPVAGLRTILWAGLRHEDPALTEEQLGAMVDAEQIPELLRSFFALFRSSGLPGLGAPAAAAAAAPPTPASPSPGTTSST